MSSTGTATTTTTGSRACPIRRARRPLFSASYGLNADEQVGSDSSAASPDGPTYGYTPLNQVCYAGPATATPCPSPGAGSTTYQYDSAQNIVVDGSNVQAYDAGDELCFTAPAPATGTCAAPPAGATAYTYDANGNRASVVPPSGPSQTLTYDQADRLGSFAEGSSTANYVYNADGLRMSKTVGATTTKYLWDLTSSPSQLLQDGTTAYVDGPGGSPLEQVSGSSVLWLHHDQLGSTRLVTSSAGAVLATYDYSAYGELTASTGSVDVPLKYAGQYLDAESGLYYFHARYYDPSTGQFLSLDPQVEQTRSPYAYGSGNPLNAPDVTGLGSCPNGVAIPFTDLCLDNPLDFQQDAQNFDQNSQAIHGTPIGDLVEADPFYDDFRDSIYADQGLPVPPGQILDDILGTGASFLPGAGKVMEWLGFKGGESVLAGNAARIFGYGPAAIIQNNIALIENFAGGFFGAQFGHLFLEGDDSSGCGGRRGRRRRLAPQRAM